MSFYTQLQNKLQTNNSLDNKKPQNSTATLQSGVRIKQKSASTFNQSARSTITADNIPLDFVKQYLKIEHDLDDAELILYLQSARSYVRNYLSQPSEEPLDIELVIPILTLTSHFYENKILVQQSNVRIDMLISGMLDMHRKGVL